MKNEDKAQKKRYVFLMAACFAVYSLSYAVKMAFTSQVETMMAVFNADKVQAGLVNTYYFIAYALTQVILSLFIGRINVKKYLLITTPLSVAVFVCVPFLAEIRQVWYVFAVGGITQAGIYAGIMLILSKYLPFSMLGAANKLMTLGTAVSLVFIYGLSALFVGINFWQGTFFVSCGLMGASIVALAFALVQFKGKGINTSVTDKERESKEKTVTGSEDKPFMVLSGKKDKAVFYVFHCLIGLLACSLYYGVFNWLTSYFKSQWNMPESFAILITLVFPIVMTAGPLLSVDICKKHGELLKVQLVLCFIILAASVSMIFAFGTNIILCIVLLVLFCVTVKMNTAIYSGIVAFNMRSQINTGSYSAITNSFASVSAGVTPPVIGGIIDAYGYSAQFIAVSAICVLLIIVLFATRIVMRKNLVVKGIVKG